jgi:hypothetical protein
MHTCLLRATASTVTKDFVDSKLVSKPYEVHFSDVKQEALE